MRVVESGIGPLIQPPDMNAFREWNRTQKNKALVDKVMSEQEAVSRFMFDGAYIGTELYGTVRCPMSLVRELIRQGYKDLRVAGQGVMELDILLATGRIKTLDLTYLGLEVYGISSNLRREVESGRVESVVEWSNGGITWRFKAAAMGVPFIPVHRADRYGNCQIDGIAGFAPEMARASKRLIISTEEIVPTDDIRAHPDRTIIPYYLVDAVVLAPYGSHPGEMCNLYRRDEELIREWVTEMQKPDTAQAYLQKYVYGVRNHDEYMNLIGRDRLESLREDRGGAR
jgi:glutaconate CoA-transferase subunit A